MTNANDASTATGTAAANPGEPGVIYAANGIRITKEIASIRGISYAVNGIGSVRVSPPASSGYIFGGISLVVGWLSVGSSKMAALILTCVALLFFVYARSKPHILIVHTASGDQSVLKGTKSHLHEIKSALEKAVTMRG